jgi:flavodoxin
MANAIVVYASETGNTEYVAEGVVKGLEVWVKNNLASQLQAIFGLSSFAKSSKSYHGGVPVVLLNQISQI